MYNTLKYSPDNKEGTIPVDRFKEALGELRVPLGGEEWEKLMKTYDKKETGSMSWDDLLTDHKYVHAVSSYYKSVINVVN